MKCSKCGKDKNDGRNLCGSCRTSKRRKNLKVHAVEYLGGECSMCGYNKCIDALEFHHKDPNKKSFGISKKGITRSWETLKKELDKCILLCANCHREIETIHG